MRSKATSHSIACLLTVFTCFFANLAVAEETKQASASLNSLAKSSSYSPADAVLPMLFGLLATVAVIFVMAWLLKKLQPLSFAKKRIKVLETQSLGFKSRLLLVQVDNKQLLLGVSGDNIRCLQQLDARQTATDDSEQLKSSGSQFAQLLKGLTNPASKNFGHSVANGSQQTDGEKRQ